MNRNQRRRLEEEKFQQKYAYDIELFFSCLPLALNELYGFGKDRCQKIIKGTRLVMEKANEQHADPYEIIIFSLAESGLDYDDVKTGRGKILDMAAAAVGLTLHSNFHFKERVRPVIERTMELFDEYSKKGLAIQDVCSAVHTRVEFDPIRDVILF